MSRSLSPEIIDAVIDHKGAGLTVTTVRGFGQLRVRTAETGDDAV